MRGIDSSGAIICIVLFLQMNGTSIPRGVQRASLIVLSRPILVKSSRSRVLRANIAVLVTFPIRREELWILLMQRIVIWSMTH